MGYCYNLIYNETTSAFEKHGTVTPDDVGVILHTCDFYVNTETIQNGLLNTSADNSVISANASLTSAITSAEQETSGSPDVDTNLGDIDMKLELVIEIISPTVKVEYLPVDVILPTSIVKR